MKKISYNRGLIGFGVLWILLVLCFSTTSFAQTCIDPKDPGIDAYKQFIDQFKSDANPNEFDENKVTDYVKQKQESMEDSNIVALLDKTINLLDQHDLNTKLAELLRKEQNKIDVGGFSPDLLLIELEEGRTPSEIDYSFVTKQNIDNRLDALNKYLNTNNLSDNEKQSIKTIISIIKLKQAAFTFTNALKDDGDFTLNSRLGKNTKLKPLYDHLDTNPEATAGEIIETLQPIINNHSSKFDPNNTRDYKRYKDKLEPLLRQILETKLNSGGFEDTLVENIMTELDSEADEVYAKLIEIITKMPTLEEKEQTYYNTRVKEAIADGLFGSRLPEGGSTVGDGTILQRFITTDDASLVHPKDVAYIEVAPSDPLVQKYLEATRTAEGKRVLDFVAYGRKADNKINGVHAYQFEDVGHPEGDLGQALRSQDPSQTLVLKVTRLSEPPQDVQYLFNNANKLETLDQLGIAFTADQVIGVGDNIKPLNVTHEVSYRDGPTIVEKPLELTRSQQHQINNTQPNFAAADLSENLSLLKQIVI